MINNLIDFCIETLGFPNTMEVILVYWVIAGMLLLIFIDAIISFILMGLSSLTMRSK